MYDEFRSDRKAALVEPELGLWSREAPAENADRDVEPVRAGYGGCTASYCTCTGFMGSAELCANCNHNYSFHS
jgi:hypothetical protein